MRRADKNWAREKAKEMCEALGDGEKTEEPKPKFVVRKNHLARKKVKFKDKVKELIRRFQL